MIKIPVDIPGMLVRMVLQVTRMRHKTRGTHYFTVITAKAQSDIKEGDAVVIYLDARTGQAQAREYNQFHDGRFEIVEDQ